MRIAAISCLPVVFLAVCFRGSLQGGERGNRSQIDWTNQIPLPMMEIEEGEEGANEPAPKPLFVYVTGDYDNPHQERFDGVVMKLELVTLASKFFDCVKISSLGASEHPLFQGVGYSPPAVIVFDSTRKKRSVAGGKASARKVYESMRNIAKLDYKTGMEKTLQRARILLGRFDQVDAARDALRIKQERVTKALSKGDGARAQALERDIRKDQAEIDKLYGETEALWNNLWKLERR